jgi:hypothetical protein
MALVHPSRSRPLGTKRELHPAIGLMAGFGILVLVATVVHLLFSLI